MQLPINRKMLEELLFAVLHRNQALATNHCSRRSAVSVGLFGESCGTDSRKSPKGSASAWNLGLLVA